MYLLNKHVHQSNVSFAQSIRRSICTIGKERFHLTVTSFGGECFRISVENPSLWPRDYNAFPVTPFPTAKPDQTHLQISDTMGFSLTTGNGKPLLSGPPGAWFGITGTTWLFQFNLAHDMRFYGLGEKAAPFERSDRSYLFWNIDALTDIQSAQVKTGNYDPDYISVPYLIVKQKNTWCGILVDSPFASFVNLLNSGCDHTGQRKNKTHAPCFSCGAENNPPSLYVLYGPSLCELTRKFHRLTGTSPVPPLWALGYHQSRWGYRDMKDMCSLADAFEKHRIPADGLWLDIDFMDNYRVFTLNKELQRRRGELATLRKRGFRVVPILDPGVKQEHGYEVYESGQKSDVFCKNRNGNEFTGVVWPGDTVFPDFSLTRTRRWWSEQVARYVATDIAGLWLDMNDPATGGIACTDMLFENGKTPHDAFHNQYASLMAAATRSGLQKAQPDARVFLISRSGFTADQKITGHWTGDNCANYQHLRLAIGRSLNLSLSGMPFQGPDIGGFCGDTTEQLLVDWVKTCFLFPFFRNHTEFSTRSQEPWAYSKGALNIIRRYIRLRYTVLPYLYNLFVEHEQNGTAILRPLLYDFPDRPGISFETVDDQFMVGPCIMQAPFVVEHTPERKVKLPHDRWYRADTGEELDGGREITVCREHATTPLFIRDGSIIPMQRGIRVDNRKDLHHVDLLIVLSQNCRKTVHYRYCVDDGETLAYQRGIRSEYHIKARLRTGIPSIEVQCTQEKYGDVSFRFLFCSPYDRMELTQDSSKSNLPLQIRSLPLFGKRMPFACSW